MRLLLDTHILIWAVDHPGRLPPEVRAILVDPRNQVLFSAVNIWEIAIKARLGRASFTLQPREVMDEALRIGFVELPVRADAAARVATLPLLHADPFDRLLVVQAITEGVPLYTADRQLKPYSEHVALIA